jgi:hypothetical protein
MFESDAVTTTLQLRQVCVRLSEIHLHVDMWEDHQQVKSDCVWGILCTCSLEHWDRRTAVSFCSTALWNALYTVEYLI